MYVCLCAAVTEKDIEQQFGEGVDSLDALASRTGCGTVCGCCKEFASQKLASLRSSAQNPSAQHPLPMLRMAVA
ncbi:MAG: (2Fe-2S)-binding protein [Xanthomonadales bacterium]|nr:(2Fe-2S)-binding protein [Xanthomonadales bacterium]